MVAVSYSHRIIVDYDYIVWLATHEKKVSVISKLLRINANSKEHPRENVVIFQNDFKNLCDKKIIKDKDITPLIDHFNKHIKPLLL